MYSGRCVPLFRISLFLFLQNKLRKQEVPPKAWCLSTKMHSVIYQNIVIISCRMSKIEYNQGSIIGDDVPTRMIIFVTFGSPINFYRCYNNLEPISVTFNIYSVEK